ncbi:MAG: hypothetical protein PVJ02_06915 [Gemmatimonadota bacterium]
MTDQPTDQSLQRTHRVSEEHERARALAEVLRDQEERALASRDAEGRRARRARLRRGAMLAAWVGMAYVWLVSPSWINVPPPERPSLAREAQSLRVNLFLESQAIEAYRRERGRLPYVLQEAGPPFRGMQYRRRDSRSYELEATSDRLRMRYDSRQPPLDFVGSAASVLETKPPLDEGTDR